MSDLMANARRKAGPAYQRLVDDMDALMLTYAQRIAASARARCTDADVRASITVVGPLTDKRGRRSVLIKAGDGSTVRVSEKGVTYQMARVIEFGSKLHPALPYFRPAFRDFIRAFKAAQTRRFAKFTKEVFNG